MQARKWQPFTFLSIDRFHAGLLLVLLLPACTAVHYRIEPMRILDWILLVHFLASIAGATITDQQSRVSRTIRFFPRP